MSSTSNRAPAGTPNFRHATKKLRMLLICREGGGDKASRGSDDDEGADAYLLLLEA